MLFNLQEYKVFQTECKTVWKWFKRVGGVGWRGVGRVGGRCILQLTMLGEAK